MGLFDGLLKTVVNTVVALPVAVVADVITLGGELTDKRGRTHTGDAIKGIENGLKEMSED